MGNIAGSVGLKLTTFGSQQIDAGSASTVGVIIKGAASQTANLTEWQDSAGTVLGSIGSGGALSARITPRVTSEASSATPTINSDNSDAHSITALALAVTSMSSGLTGTPTNFQRLVIRFLDNGTGRAITWGASFVAKGVALPTTTVAGKLLTVGFIYDTVLSTWGCVASVQES